MKLIRGQNCIALSYKDELLFVHSDIVPFLTIVSGGRKKTLSPLPICEAVSEEETRIVLSFKNENDKVTAVIQEENDALSLTLEGVESEFFLYVHAKQGEKITGRGIPEEDLKGKIFVNANKTSEPSKFAKIVFGKEKYKIAGLTPLYYGDGYGIKIIGDVSEMDFSSNLCAKITCKNMQKLIFAVSENKDELRNALD